jgi:membrane protease YdiL (CAAX protease family)
MIYLPPMDTPPPDDVPPEIPIVLPAADLPPLGEPSPDVPVLVPAWATDQTEVAASHLGLWVAIVVGGAAYVSLFFLGDEARLLGLAGLQPLPFAGLALLAYLGRRLDGAKIATCLYWLMLMGLFALTACGFVLLAVLKPEILRTLIAGRPLPPVKHPDGLFRTGGVLHIAWCAAGVALGVLVGITGFLPRVRRFVAAVIPIDPNDFVHAAALATVLGMTVIGLVPLLTLGEPPLLIILHETGREGMAGDKLTRGQELRVELYTLLWQVPAAVLAVGFPLARGLRAAMQRLGMVWPGILRVVGAAMMAVVFVFVFECVLGPLITRLWGAFHWPQTDAKMVEKLLESFASPLGAVVIGIVAGLGEEIAVRGVLQPRMGIFLSNLFFAAGHALQYNFDALLGVFLIGMTLGVIRKRTDTTTTAIIHGTYDFLLVLASYYKFDPSSLFGW